MLNYFRDHLSWKLFFSYILVVLVSTLTLNVAAQLALPTALDRHMGGMDMMSGDMGGMMGDSSTLDAFSNAFDEVMLLSILIASLTAAFVSIFVSRKFIAPVQHLTAASQKITQGDYQERVALSPGNDELHQLAARFNQMAAALENNEEIRKQLIGDVAHELRTPLTTIKGSMEGLIDGVLSSTPETFQHLYRETDRMQTLINDLQELSRVEAGGYQLDLKTGQIADVIETTQHRLAQQFKDKGVALKLDLAEQLPASQIDEDRIGQVLLNLVGNALQYTSQGGSVTINAQCIENELRVSVIDDGIGIEAQHLALMFTRFYRVDKSRARAHGGSGIGLTISKHLIEAHGGEIWAESAGLGHGTKVIFTLPI